MKPKLIGITGGIGAGKSTVSQIFKHLGFKVYNSDERAKSLISLDTNIKNKLISSFGNEVFINGILDKNFLSELIFKRKTALEEINAIVHPEVKKDFLKWVTQNSLDQILFKESALLFETEAFRELDKIIYVSAPKKLRIERVLSRDNHRSVQDIENIISNQINDSEATNLCDYKLNNDEKELLLPSVISLLDKIKTC